jgi:Ca2+-binding EF-hand superfamily protein
MDREALGVEIPEDVKAIIPEEKLMPLVEVFKRIDANRDGKIELDEFLDFSLDEARERITLRFEAVDSDSDGSIEFEEFVQAIEPNYQILKRFRQLDLDRNGLLSVEEAIDIANQLVLPLSGSQVKALIKEVDRDGDAQITYYEYLGVIAHIGFQ